MTRKSTWPFIAFAGEEPNSPTNEHEADTAEDGQGEPHLIVGASRLNHETTEGATHGMQSDPA